MRQLTPAEFHARFAEGQKVVFVGSAPSLKDEKLGAWIESHDVVVRFNEVPAPGYEEHVGERTDILVTNPYPEGRRPLRLTERGTVLVISPQTRRPFSDEFEGWVGEHPVFYTYAPDIVQVGGIEHMASLTTGTYGVHLLNRLLRPAQAAITGFTLFLQDTSHHYWSTQTPRGVHAHDAQAEAGIFISICNSFRCPLEATEEIGWVAHVVGRTLAPHVRSRRLANPRWSRR